MKKDVLKIVVAVLLCCGGLSQAAPITIQISGNITSIAGYTAAIPSTIHAGVTFTGTYTYDSLASDSDSSVQRGVYQHNSPYGISISLGGYTFATAPNHVGKFVMIIKNNDTTNGVIDCYTVFSAYQNIPSIGFAPDSISWNLRDSTYDALSSDALPATAPVLTDWNYNVLSIGGVYGPDLYGLTIYGTVTQAILVPEPLTGLLMITGVLFLRRKQ
ncbi:MAG: hypothetical protein WC770_07610 [Phycisphaerae bacterium]|jgi:cation transporter-like permease